MTEDEYETNFRKHAKLSRKDIGDFVYFRSERIDQLGELFSTEEIEKAIIIADSYRPKLSLNTGWNDSQYNVWTHVKNYLQFLKYEVARDDYLDKQRQKIEDSSHP